MTNPEEDRPATDDPLFPSGPWRGFYVYRGSPSRHRMDLRLHFREGTVDGQGADDIGTFSIRGRYDASSLELLFRKHYPASHDVHYRGFREGQGIWGTWTIGSLTSGGFRLWPNGFGASESASAESSVALPAEAVPAAPALVTTSSGH